VKRSTDGPIYIIGLTGNIATGKSTVLAYLASKGAHIIDADKLAHKAMAPDGPAYAKVVDAFGDEIVTAAGQIDRAQLGDIVFHDPDALRHLEAIVHPATFELLRWDIMESDAEVVVLEAIKLLESGQMVNLSDEIWVVTSTPEAQLERLLKRRGMSEADAHARMAAQPPQAQKIARADEVIENNGDLAALHLRLDALWAAIIEKLDTRRMAKDGASSA
jgi:dephospho-CoA kinase